jgi:hypothetical protein
MELKDQVCTLESAKRLKELKVEQESLFYWRGVKYNPYSDQEDFEIGYIGEEIDDSKLPKELKRKGHKLSSKISAFTTSELGEMFPKQKLELKCSYTS